MTIRFAFSSLDPRYGRAERSRIRRQNVTDLRILQRE